MQGRTVSEALSALLNSHSQSDEEFWSFRGDAKREHAHAYFQYPAMMVPRMQEHLIADVKKIMPDVQHAFDPFVGSGTTMTEAMMQGLCFTGQDINPLAVLICRAKMGPFHEQALRHKLQVMMDLIRTDHDTQIGVDFTGRDKWFQNSIAVALAKIRRAILREPDLWCRRFCWVALAEAVRLSSNSRTSTFKLHIREKIDIERREKEISPIHLFEEILAKNLENFSKQKMALGNRSLLAGECYRFPVDVSLRDSAAYVGPAGTYDLLITSPPYGDNVSTVPYGQHSFLPLQWIDLHDIDESITPDWLKTTHEIDRRSLGGIKEDALDTIKTIMPLSRSFRETIEELEQMPQDDKSVPKDRVIRVAAFYRDLNRCLDPILRQLKPHAYMLWTVGNRRVAGLSIPIDRILVELLCARGAVFVTCLQRTIPTKRMALRTKIATTMRSETVLVMKKGSM